MSTSLRLAYVRENNSIIYVFIGLKSHICHKNTNSNLILDERKISAISSKATKAKVVDMVICSSRLWQPSSGLPSPWKHSSWNANAVEMFDSHFITGKKKKKRMLFSKSCQAKGALIHGDSQARCCLFLAADVKLCFSLFIVCLASVNTFLSYTELFTFSNLVMPLLTILFPRHQKNNQICLFPWRERRYVSIEILNRVQTWRILLLCRRVILSKTEDLFDHLNCCFMPKWLLL